MPSKKNNLALSDIAGLFHELSVMYPDPKTELQYGNDFQLLVAVALSAQTTDKAVNAATQDFFKKVHTPEQLIEYSIEELEQVFRRIGLYRTKARHIWMLSHQLISEHAGKVPLNEAALQALPGVGRKTSHVVLNTLQGAPLIAVDTHVYRVSRRLGIADAQDRDRVGVQLMQRVPEKFLVPAHHYLIAHGRQVCKARAPACQECQLASWCEYRRISK